MRVRFAHTGEEREVSGARTVAGLLKQLGLQPETVLVIRDDTLLPGDERLGPDDVLEIRPVISGGAEASGPREPWRAE